MDKLSLDVLATVAGAYKPTRHELLQLARMQAELGVEAIKAGQIGVAKAFLVDALDYLDRVKP